MFNSRIASNDCNIIKCSLLDDLMSYNIIDDNTLLFSDGSSSALSSRFNDLSQEISGDSSKSEVWQPIFINHDNHIDTKMLSGHGSYLNGNTTLKSGRIGIENFFTFSPKFKSWEIQSESTVMSVDWILNKTNSYFSIYYGLLGWYRYIDSDNSRSIGGASTTIDNFPNGSRLKHGSSPKKIFIKISDDILLDITNSSQVSVSSFGSQPQFNLADTYFDSQGNQTKINTLKIQSNKSYSSSSGNGSSANISTYVHLWIPDGDFFAYFNSESEKQISFDNNISSSSYISPVLYNTYTNIYRIITLDEPRSFDSMDLRKSRAYKKLAHAISTSPFITDFCINALDYIDIRKVIQNYINNQNTITNIDKDIALLTSTLLSISEILQNTIGFNTSLFLDTKSQHLNLNNNIICNNQQLFHKLLNKYGAQLMIEGQCGIQSKKDALKFNNNGIVITQVTDSYINKDISDKTVYNNQEIFFDNIAIKTDNSLITNNLDIYSNNNKITIPLADFAKPSFGNDSIFNIKLEDQGLVFGEYRNDTMFFSPDGTYDTYTYQTMLNIDPTTMKSMQIGDEPPACASYIAEDGILLTAIEINPELVGIGENGSFDPYSFLESEISIIWEQIAGPEGHFGSENDISGISNTTTFFTSYTGKFVVQCTISSPFGSFRKQKTFYIIDGREVIPDPLHPPSINTFYGKYWDPLRGWVDPPTPNPNNSETKPIHLNIDKLKVQTSKINAIAINNLVGVVWPIKTSMKIREDVGRKDARQVEMISNLSGGYRFKYKSQYSPKDNAKVLIFYDSNNTIIKIHSIFLEKIRTNEIGCENCLSFYEPIVSSKQAVQYFNDAPDPSGPSRRLNVNQLYRNHKYPSSFTLISYKWNNNQPRFEEYITYEYPEISTEFAPSIKSYGGYSDKLISSLGVNIPDHPRPQQTPFDSNLVAANSPVLPTVTGYKLNYIHEKNPDLIKMCYQKALTLTPTSGSIMTFNKGVLHPNSGWLPHYASGYQIHANRCGLLKFNPGARDSFSFIGPMISNLSNNYVDITNNTIGNKVFSSSITLNLAQEIQFEPDCSCRDLDTNQYTNPEAVGIPRYNDNQTHKEYADIDYNISSHGYRILAGGKPKQAEISALRNSPFVNDEFLIDQNNIKNSISYSFAVTGPSIVPEQILAESGKIKLRNPRVNSFGIKDIEVKLNFLNYVNTKNLVVWLEVDLDKEQYAERYRVDDKGRPQLNTSPIRSKSEFIDQSFDTHIMSKGWKYDTSSLVPNNDDLSLYLHNLIDMNSNIFREEGEPLKLILLNQEHIQNNQYNFSIKFSDNASKHNSLYDINILETTVAEDILNSSSSSSQSSSSSSTNNSKKIQDILHSPYGLGSIYQNIVRSNDSIQPTVAATGFSDRQSCLYRSVIKNNKLNITNNTLNKLVCGSLFMGREPPPKGPCGTQYGGEGGSPQAGRGYNGGTTFTLKMMVLDETDDMDPKDTLNHQYKPGFDIADNQVTSCMISNSLCNWELIMHVGPVNKPVPYSNPDLTSYGNIDTLSLIDYDKDPSYPGYSFISDLSKYKHLLPLANYNAPYTCIADSNLCLGKTNGDLTGGSLLIKPPDFPSYAILQIMSSMVELSVGSAGTLAGLLAGLPGLLNNPGYNAIINYLHELKYIYKLENAGRQLYAPSYNKYPFGSPEKILINFKKPDSLWYTAEVPILKYHNTPILKPNQYKFIRLRRGIQKNISEFSFTVITDYLDLIDDQYKKQLNLNSIYDLIKSTTFLKHNIIIGGGKAFFDSSFMSALTSNKVILLPSRIPYDIFVINDTIDCYDGAESSEPFPPSLKSMKIINKALFLKNNKYYTGLILDTPITSENTIAPSYNSHIFFIYDNITSIENKLQKKYNIWGLDRNKRPIGSSTPSIAPTVHSAGSYGDLSPFLDKNMLSNNIQYNQLQTYEDIFNNRLNDKLKHNKLTIVSNSGESINLQHDSCYGFVYSEKDINAQIFDTKNNAYYITPEFLRPDGDTSYIFDKLKDQIIGSTSNENELSHRYGYIRANIKDSIHNLSTDIISGNLLIENDFIEYIPIQSINESDRDILANRINTIDDVTYSAVDDLIGDPNHTIQILQSSNLSSILKHYQSLPDDPAQCHRPDNPDTLICYKQQTEQKINDLYKERQEILDLLDSQTVRHISLTYQNIKVSGELISENTSMIVIKPISHENTSSSSSSNSSEDLVIIPRSDISVDDPIIRTFVLRSSLDPSDTRYIDKDLLAKFKPTITTDTNTQAITITYDPINTDHYWINLDPKQSTVKDFEKNPKILIDTKYYCELANPLRSLTKTGIKNNVCPFDASHPGQLPKADPTVTDESFIQDHSTTFIYSISETIIDELKTKYEQEHPCILGWKIFTKQRFFNINGDQVLDAVADAQPNTEITVTADERYWIPITLENQGKTEKGKNDHSADANPVNGMGACDTTKGSIGGFGLFTSYGMRINEPTRIYNIVNLDDIDEISVSIKRIPRMLRGVDLLSTVYRYGLKNLYRQNTATQPLIPNEVDAVGLEGSINNSLYYWTCFQKTDISQTTVQPTKLPPFFQLQNEMIFRALFGSVDKIENKFDTITSYYPWELIPYEYSPD